MCTYIYIYICIFAYDNMQYIYIHIQYVRDIHLYTDAEWDKFKSAVAAMKAI